ncbi:MAG: redoxin domain-containing protein [candidate division Zixibacteria bacterium]|nr:redoxin domain-containing protein [candidate division Zixibacteria bacterium]
MLEIGEAASDFDLGTSTGGRLSLADLRGRFGVIVFYPKNNTPG